MWSRIDFMGSTNKLSLMGVIPTRCICNWVTELLVAPMIRSRYCKLMTKDQEYYMSCNTGDSPGQEKSVSLQRPLAILMRNTISDTIFSIFPIGIFFKSLSCILSYTPYGSGNTLVNETFN